MAKTKAPRPRQPRLHPSLEPERIPAIDAASRDYTKARDAHAAQTKLLTEKKDDLMKLMHKHKQKIGTVDGVTRYETADDTVVVLSEKEELKVKRRGAENEET